MSAPVKIGTKNGKFEVFLDKQLLFSDNLFTIYNVEGKSLLDKIKDFWQKHLKARLMKKSKNMRNTKICC